MKKLLLLTALFVAATFSACKYDDDDIWNSVHGLEDRVAKLEELCKQMNTNISSLQTIVTALQNNDYVTSVTPVTKNGETIGYTISFTKSSPITIYHGEKGEKGDKGETGATGATGAAGQDGHTPVIGVRQDADGIYYWTLDGDCLLDGAGNKVKAEGRDGESGKDGNTGADGQPGQPGEPGTPGKDGITPQLKIENGYWYVSTDNGATWTNLGKATGADGTNGAAGKDGDSMFQSVTQDEDNVYFTLADGEIITLPKKQSLSITFSKGNSLQFDEEETQTTFYTITGGSDNNVVKAEMQNLDGAYTLYTRSTSATQGTIRITAKVPTSNRVIVSVSDGTQTVMTAIAVSIKPDLDETVITVETPGALSKLLAGYNKNTITELTIIGNLNITDIRALGALPNLAVLDMENANLEALPNVAFRDKTSLISVKLPRTLKTIGASAFYHCNSLTSIIISDGVTEIGEYAFAGCTGLTSIIIPDGVKEIEQFAFSGCSGLSSIKIPNNVTIIGTSAFSNCSGLTSLTIPDNVTEIGVNAFGSCSNLTSITIPNSVTTIGISVFHDCSSLTSVMLPDGVTTIGDYTFSGCSNLTSITIPNSVTEIGNAAFGSCSNLTSITIPNNVMIIGQSAFSGCSSLTSITIPDSVTTIGNDAFYNCSGLTSVNIGDSVASIGRSAFMNCTNITEVYCKAIVPPSVENQEYVFSACWTLYVPVGSKAAYAAANEWSRFTTIIETKF